VGWALPNPKRSFRPPFSKGGGVQGQSPWWVKSNFFFTLYIIYFKNLIIINFQEGNRMAVRGIKGETDRLRLEEHIPLETPLRVFIDVSSICNFHCAFCPHGNGEAQKEMPQSFMDFELAKKCIDDLTKFNSRIKMLSFFCFGEPLLYNKLIQVIQYAKERGIAEQIEITTNGSLLSEYLAKELIKAGISLINISLYGLSTYDYRKFSNVTLNFESLVEKISYLYSIRQSAKIVVKISDAICETPQKQEDFYRIFNSICDKICIEHAVPFWHKMKNSVEDNDINIYGKPVQRKTVCPVPFYVMCVQANGIVSPCCVDWKQCLPMGDSKIESLFSIWNSEKYRLLYRKLLQYGNKGVSPCDSCRYHELVALDNIDDFRTDLLKKLEEKDAL